MKNKKKGLSRESLEKHKFYINHKLCEVIGRFFFIFIDRVCMDQVIVFVDKEKICNVGDYAYYINHEISSVSEPLVTKRNNTISYTLFTSLTSRPVRVAKF
jgi:alanine racemase